MNTAPAPAPFHTAAVAPSISTLVGEDLAYVTKYLTDPERACPGALQYVQWVPTTYWHETRGAWCLPNHHPGGAINTDAVFARPLHYDKYTEAEKLAWLTAKYPKPDARAKAKFPKAVVLGPEGFPIREAALFVGPTAIKLLEAGKKELIIVEAAPISEQVSQLLGIPCIAIGGCHNGVKTRGIPKPQLLAPLAELLQHYGVTATNIWFDSDLEPKTITTVEKAAHRLEYQLHKEFKGLAIKILRPHEITGLCDGGKSEPAVQLARSPVINKSIEQIWIDLTSKALTSTESVEFHLREKHYRLKSPAINAIDLSMAPYLVKEQAEGLAFIRKARPTDTPVSLSDFVKHTKHIKIACLNSDSNRSVSLPLTDVLEWSSEIRNKYLVTKVIRDNDHAEGLMPNPEDEAEMVYNAPIPLPSNLRKIPEDRQADAFARFQKLYDVMCLVNDPNVVEDAFKVAWWCYHNPGMHPHLIPGFAGPEGSFKTSLMLAFIIAFGVDRDTLESHYQRAGVEADQAFGMVGEMPREKFSHADAGRAVACGYDEATTCSENVARSIKTGATTAAQHREMQQQQKTLRHGQFLVFAGRKFAYLLEVNGTNRRERPIKLLGLGTGTYQGRPLTPKSLGALYGVKVETTTELKAEVFAPLGNLICEYPLGLYQWIEHKWSNVKDFKPDKPAAHDPKFPLEFYDMTELARQAIYNIPPFPVLFGVTVNAILVTGIQAQVTATDFRQLPGYMYSTEHPQTWIPDKNKATSEIHRIPTQLVVHKNYTDVWFEYLNKSGMDGRWNYHQLLLKLCASAGVVDKFSDTEQEILKECLKRGADLIQITKDFYSFDGYRSDEVY